MRTSFAYPIIYATLLIASQSPSLFAEEKATKQDAPLERTEAIHATLAAEVTAIDLATREVTLKGPLGNEVTVTAGDAVKRLDEVKVGDFVRVDYLASVAAEVRPPTAEEAKNPLVIVDAAGRATTNSAPAGGVARRFKVVTTIEALSRPDQTITVKGPLGRYLTVSVADPERLTKVHIGETIVIVYTEALAVSLEKTTKKSAD